MKVQSRAMLTAVLGLALAAPVAAGQQRSKQAERFRAMDRNGDGVITREEWQGNAKSFAVHDWNRDGQLSGDELAAGTRPSQRPAAPAETGGQLADWTAERFVELDHDRNGRLTRDEWHFELATFRRVDRDANGWLSRQEFLGHDLDDDRGNRFDDVDVNRDGRVSTGEWHGGAAEFRRRDLDRNGTLSRTELGAEADDAPQDLFDSLDVDRNGRVASSEWHWSRAAFDRRDADRNGSLSRAEVEASDDAGRASRRDPAYRAGYDRGIGDGRQAGREDKRRNTWDLDGQRELEQADAGYTSSVGARPEYQAGYREGFTEGYREGFGPRR